MVLTLPHSLAFARLALVIFLASSPLFHPLLPPFSLESPTTLLLLLIFHQTPTLHTPLVSPQTYLTIHPDFPLFPSPLVFPIFHLKHCLIILLSILLCSVPFVSFLLSNPFPSLLPHSPSLSSPRGCWVCLACCSMRLSGCFSTRRTRTASTNREPSGVSVHLPAKCKPPCTQCHQAQRK